MRERHDAGQSLLTRGFQQKGLAWVLRTASLGPPSDLSRGRRVVNFSQIRRIGADLPIAVTSGFIDEELRAGADRNGVSKLVAKPFAINELYAVVQRTAQAARRRDAGFTTLEERDSGRATSDSCNASIEPPA